jgi:hypothetical protein
MRIRIGGLAIGIVLAAIDIFLLVYLPSVGSQYVKNFGADISGTLGTVFLSSTAIALAIAIAILAIPSRAVKDAPKVSGGAKLLQGIVLAVYYYVILNGGTVSLSLVYSDVKLIVTATLLITLALLELSAVFRILQGLTEMREHPRPPMSPVSLAPTIPAAKPM